MLINPALQTISMASLMLMELKDRYIHCPNIAAIRKGINVFDGGGSTVEMYLVREDLDIVTVRVTQSDHCEPKASIAIIKLEVSYAALKQYWATVEQYKTTFPNH